jgi:hypothetical protein
MNHDDAERPEPDDRSHHASDVPVKVAIGSFRDFQRWIDKELDRLVAQWAHAAAPIASHPRGRRRFRGPR